jgi:hypothetical protein
LSHLGCRLALHLPELQRFAHSIIYVGVILGTTVRRWNLDILEHTIGRQGWNTPG